MSHINTKSYCVMTIYFSPDAIKALQIGHKYYMYRGYSSAILDKNRAYIGLGTCTGIDIKLGYATFRFEGYIVLSEG